jgi:hypothetical protein
MNILDFGITTKFLVFIPLSTLCTEFLSSTSGCHTSKLRIHRRQHQVFSEFNISIPKKRTSLTTTFNFYAKTASVKTSE